MPEPANPLATPPISGAAGDPDLEPVVLVNALGQGDRAWSRLTARLGHRHIVVWSPDAEHTQRQQAAALAEVLATQGRPAHLVAWCTGPKTVLRVAAERPDLVSSLVMLNPSFKTPRRPAVADTAYETELEALCRAVAAAPQAADRLATVLGARRAASTSSQAEVPEELRESAALAFSDGASLAAYATQHLEFWEDDPLADPAVTSLALPVTVVSGRNDVVVAVEDMAEVLARLPHARSQVIDAGHFALHTHATDVAELIDRHLVDHTEGTLTRLGSTPPVTSVSAG